MVQTAIYAVLDRHCSSFIIFIIYCISSDSLSSTSSCISSCISSSYITYSRLIRSVLHFFSISLFFFLLLYLLYLILVLVLHLILILLFEFLILFPLSSS